MYLATETSRRTTKIGKTKDYPSKRETTLNGTRMPMEAKIFKIIKSPYYDMAEDIIHKLYERYRIKSKSTGRYTEWFDLEPMDVVSLCLLTASDIEKLCTSKKRIFSISELFEDGRDLFLRSDSSHIEKMIAGKQKEIDRQNHEISQLKEKIVTLEKKNQLLAFNIERGSENSEVENTVRTALRSLARQ